MARPAQAVIYLDALRHNLKIVKSLTSEKICAVVKSDAYGHGIVPVSQVLQKEKVDALAVCCIEEAIELRENNITIPIVLLEGFFDSSELPLIDKYDLTTIVHNLEQIDDFVNFHFKNLQNVWLKLDTGMNRLGLLPEIFSKQYQRLKDCTHVKNIVITSHFANAEEPQHYNTIKQIKCFDSTIKNINTPVSFSNSAAILNGLYPRDSWVRPGAMLFGINPVSENYNLNINLKPVMELKTKIIAVKYISSGSYIGYGKNYKAQQKMKIGIAGIGYGDGYPYKSIENTPVIVNGCKSAIIGSVTMDTVSIDLSNIPNAGIGSEVILWGNSILGVEDIALATKNIHYSLLTGIKRISKIYKDENLIKKISKKELEKCELSFNV